MAQSAFRIGEVSASHTFTSVKTDEIVDFLIVQTD
jgi:hypothetical protein